LFGCNDNNYLNENNNSKKPNSKNENPSLLSLTNPSDSIGVMHNELLDYFKMDYEDTLNNYLKYQGIAYYKRIQYENFKLCAYDYFVNYKLYSPSEINAIIDSLDNFYQEQGLFVTINGIDYVKIIKDY
jgi:hypothetical protein